MAQNIRIIILCG